MYRKPQLIDKWDRFTYTVERLETAVHRIDQPCPEQAAAGVSVRWFDMRMAKPAKSCL